MRLSRNLLQCPYSKRKAAISPHAVRGNNMTLSKNLLAAKQERNAAKENLQYAVKQGDAIDACFCKV
nr:MAG TPA: hypothetical protein [Caudoviricetes sp.]